MQALDHSNLLGSQDPVLNNCPPLEEQQVLAHSKGI